MALDKLFFPDGDEGMRRGEDRLAVLWVGGAKNCFRRLFHRPSAVFGQQVGGIEEAESAVGDFIRLAREVNVKILSCDGNAGAKPF